MVNRATEYYSMHVQFPSLLYVPVPICVATLPCATTSLISLQLTIRRRPLTATLHWP